MKHKIFSLLVLLLTAATGAWADDPTFDQTTFTSGQTYDTFITVNQDTEITISEGVAVTINSGLIINGSATLTVNGPGALIVNGMNGGPGTDGSYNGGVGTDGCPGIVGCDGIFGSGTLVIKDGAIVYATGGNGGQGGNSDDGGNVNAGIGGNGGNGVSVTVSITTGVLVAVGGFSGSGGWDVSAGQYANNGAEGNGFKTFPSISGATLSWSDDGSNWTSYNGSTELKKFMTAAVTEAQASIEVTPVAQPAANTQQWTFEMIDADVELTPIYAPGAEFAWDNETQLLPSAVENEVAGSYNAILNPGITNEGTLYYCVTETDAIPAFSTTTWSKDLPTAQSITMPGTVYGWAYIVGDDTHSDNGVFGPYAITLKRDLFDRVSAMLDNGYYVRLTKENDKYQPVETLTFTLTDLSTTPNKTLVEGTDYTFGGLQVMGENNHWVDVTDVTNLPPGLYRAQFYGMGDFAGWKPTDVAFQLFYGYEVYVPAHEYVTYYSDDPLTEEDDNAALYTITSVSNDAVTVSPALTVAAPRTPLLIENSSDQSRNILLFPTDNQPDDVYPALEFIGTLEGLAVAGNDSYYDNYVFNGLDFVKVNNDITLGANRCYIAIPTGGWSARSLTLRFDGGTTRISGTNGQSGLSGDWYDLNGCKLNAAPTKRGVYIQNGQKVVIK